MYSLPFKHEMKRIVANLYWITEGAVGINNEEPYTLTSGNKSPIYLDSRVLISSRVAMSLITAFAHAIVDELPIDVIAGGESAGIPYAEALAEKTNKPLIYVRKQLKSYGSRSQIEGILKQRQRVLLVEDLITDGGSKLDFITEIRNAGGIVEYCLVVFDRLQGGGERLNKVGVELLALTDIDVLLTLGLEEGYISQEDYNSIRAYLKDPRDWHQERGFIYYG